MTIVKLEDAEKILAEMIDQQQINGPTEDIVNLFSNKLKVARTPVTVLHHGHVYMLRSFTTRDLHQANQIYNAREQSDSYLDHQDQKNIKLIETALEKGHYKLIATYVGRPK